nr:hypothetical protein CFP56_72808 [Quercus suber]
MTESITYLTIVRLLLHTVTIIRCDCTYVGSRKYAQRFGGANVACMEFRDLSISAQLFQSWDFTAFADREEWDWDSSLESIAPD